MNGYWRSFILLAGLTALFMGAGWALGGSSGMWIALALAMAMNVYSYWNADTLVLRMYRARRASPLEAPELHDIVHRLATGAGMPMPAVYLIDTPQPNAFATGRDPAHAAVAATTGLMQQLSREEIAGVMAHELAHVKNRDTLIMTITATLAGAISMLANFAFFFGGNRNNPLGLVGAILMMIVAPLAAMVVQMAISRSREYEADRGGAEICGNPLWLARALERLEREARRAPNLAAETHPASAHVFIVNPLRQAQMAGLFSTHPSTAERVWRLEAMAASGGGAITGKNLERNEVWGGPWG